MEDLNCDFCSKKFKTFTLLKRHQENTKYCILLQEGKDQKEKIFNCDYCKKNLTTKRGLIMHLLSCKQNKIVHIDSLKKLTLLEDENRILCEENKLLNDKNKLLNDKNKLLKKDNNDKINIIDTLEYIKLQTQEYIKEQNENIKDLQLQLKELAIKAIERPTTTNNSIINRLELNTYITPENIEDKIQRKFNDNYIPNGIKDVAKFVYEWILKSEDGNLIYACYDRSRLIFKYKDANGIEIKDPKESQLSNIIKPGLVKKLAEMLKYFTDEFDYLNSRKDRDLEYDIKEYNTLKFLKEKSLELGFELTGMNDNNVFSNELANLTS